MAMFDDRNGPMDLGLTVKEPRHPVRSKWGMVGIAIWESFSEEAIKNAENKNLFTCED
jgi:GTP:adenosylcobinamide-phosphate guanylyltransferase